VRLGVQEDFGEMLLPAVLGPFARAHPKVKIEARVARNGELLERVASGRLDLALAWDDGEGVLRGERVAELPMGWIGAADGNGARPGPDGEPSPLIVFEPPCLFRTAATAALDHAGIAWRVAFTSPSLAGLWAATTAGLGLTIRTAIGLQAGVRRLGGDGLPALPMLALTMYQAEADAMSATARLAEIMRQVVREAASSVR
jgi:DNA-binding transcriptional LysR family regulator